MIPNNRRLILAALAAAIVLTSVGCSGDPSIRFARTPDGEFNEGNGRAVVTWEPVENPEFGGYFVYIGKRRRGHKIKATGVPVKKTTLTVEGLAVNEKYYFQIRVASNTVPMVEGPFSKEFEVVAEPVR